MRLLTFLLFSFLIFSCKNPKTNTSKEAIEIIEETPLGESSVVGDTTTLVKDFRDFKVLDSKYINNTDLWSHFNKDLEDFTVETYHALKSLIIEVDMPSLQKHVSEGRLSYELLTKFYLYRIRKFDRDNDLSLNSVISLNPNILAEAKQKDIDLKNRRLKHPIFGMPILLKDNINASGMPTTAGAVVLQNNMTDDAFIVKQLKNKGALILGKANLSEWAYFFCGDCPSGYSAVGGQTLNPYGRRVMDTGGSSSGSAVAVAANFCVAAVGSETSGSILSPSSQNSVVGLKPEVGLLSRSGIIPISSTLDTPGPIAKNVVDVAILLSALYGYDSNDSKSFKPMNSNWTDKDYLISDKTPPLKGKRLGVFKSLLTDSLYTQALDLLKKHGVEIIEFEKNKIELPDFLRLLNLDMKKDLPVYFSEFGDQRLNLKSVADVIAFNVKDSANRMPYGQKLFRGVAADQATKEALHTIKKTLKNKGAHYFDVEFKKYNLDAILSINNYHAGYAAVAEYPAITVPMGYTGEGVPKGLTFIGKSEKWLLDLAYMYEEISKQRKAPANYNWY